MNQIIDSMRDEVIETLSRWVKIPSVEAPAAEDAPFGENVKKALAVALEDAQKMGFSVRNFDNYAGDVRMGPEGVNPLAILGHLDVVPTGEGWTMDPYGAEIKDGKIYGRGTSDDKGPVVAALYAMYALKKAGIPLKREIRLILGCNEETGMLCMKHYAQVCDMPKSGFSPDANFPLINTEKGALRLNLKGEYCKTGLPVKEINIGEATNVVPGKASCAVFGDEALAEKINQAAKELGLKVSAAPQSEGLVFVESIGIAGHAAFPEIACNALGQMLVVLNKLGLEGPLKTLAEKIGLEYSGESLGVVCSDAVSGALTCNMGILRYNEKDGLFATLDIRFPILVNAQALESTIAAALAPNVQVELRGLKTPHHVSPNSELVKKLLRAYEEETGLKGSCMAIGGGTYASCLEEGVAFGSIFPGEEELCHQADEYMIIDSIMKNIKIFAKAIELLQD